MQGLKMGPESFEVGFQGDGGIDTVVAESMGRVMPITGSGILSALHFRTIGEGDGMSAPCTKCGTPLETAWTFCPKCGLAVVVREPGEREQHREHEKSSMPGAFGGLLFGVIAAPVLIILGTLLCLTGLGAILGVPMIIAAIIAPLAGPLLGLGEHSVRCPWCKTREITVADDKLHYCPNCDKEFSVGEHRHAAQAG